MLAPIFFGVVLGLGLWCAARSFIVPARPLDAALEALGESRWSAADGGSSNSGLNEWAQRCGRWIMSITSTDMLNLKSDLAVLDRNETHHLLERIKTGLFWAVLPPVFWVLPILVSGSPWFSSTLAVVASVAFAVGGWFLTDQQVRVQAAGRRKEFEAALVTYLGLVSILMAGGAGIHQALRDAVDQGQGWSFQLLRRSLTDARVRGISPWDAMAEQGARLEIEALVDLAATMELAGTSGAHIRESLMVKAKALRTSQISEIEREASGRTTAMAGPTGLMMTGFVILLLYPAVHAVMGL